jgi:hypothetical protein
LICRLNLNPAGIVHDAADGAALEGFQQISVAADGDDVGDQIRLPEFVGLLPELRFTDGAGVDTDLLCSAESRLSF